MGSLIDKKTKDAIDGLNKIAALLDKEEARQIKDSMDKKKNTWSASDYVATALTLTKQTIRKLDESRIMTKTDLQKAIEKLKLVTTIRQTRFRLELINECIEIIQQADTAHSKMAENYLELTTKIAKVREWADNNLPANSSLFDILGDKI